jgi:broad specificity phosphatase PhoE
MKLNNTYYILRHGLSTSNIQHWAAGWPETKRKSHLISKNKKQIKRAAQDLKKIRLDFIYSSDMHRTKQTSAIVSKITNVKVVFDKKLREINYGIFNNTDNDNYKNYFKNKTEWMNKRPPKGESHIDCQKRMINTLKKIDKKHKDKKILIVSHGNPLWLLEGFVKNWNRIKLLKEIKNRILPGEYRKLN